MPYSDEQIESICNSAIQQLSAPGVGQKRGAKHISGTVILAAPALQVVDLQRYVMNNPDRLDEATLLRVQHKWFEG